MSLTIGMSVPDSINIILLLMLGELCMQITKRRSLASVFQSDPLQMPCLS